MGVVRAMVRFEGDTLTPEDIFINTWHFLPNGGILTEGVADQLTAQLDNFYKSPHGGQPGFILEYSSSFLTGNVEIRFYDLADAKPRTPITRSFVFTPVASGSLPAEVSVVMSFEAGKPVTRSRRGRLYLGPLNANAMNATSTSDRHISPTLQTMIAHAAAYMSDPSTAHPWAIWSEKLQSAAVVETGWVDDAFDTQRRRGSEALTRVTYIGGAGIQGPFTQPRFEHVDRPTPHTAGV